MRISVVIPCHNAGPWIGESLRSVAGQTRQPFEVIVIDDASTDNSLEQIRQVGVPVRLLKVQFRNAAAARNAGIEISSGDWVALLDADDVWYPNHLERAAELLAGTNDVAYRALCDEMTVAGKRIPATKRQPIDGTQTGLSHQEYIDLEDQELYFGHSSVLYKRDRVVEVGGFEVTQVRRHDIDLWLRLIHGNTWTWNSIPTVVHRCDTPGCISSNYVECELFYLKALIRNYEWYRSPAIDSLLTKYSRRAMTFGFTDGTPEQYREACRIAWPYLTAKVKMAYLMAQTLPQIARKMIRYKRSITKWRKATYKQSPTNTGIA